MKYEAHKDTFLWSRLGYNNLIFISHHTIPRNKGI